MHTGYGRCLGAKYAFTEIVSQPLPQDVRSASNVHLIAPLDIYVYEPTVGRIMKKLTLGHLVGIKPLVIISRDLVDYRHINIPCLQHDHPLPSATPGTSGYLCHQLEGAFVGAEIRKVEHSIGIHDTYNIDIIKIKPLGYHLRADEHISASLLKVCKYLVIRIFRTCGVQIEPCHTCCRKMTQHLLLNALCTHTTLFKCMASA